MPANKIISAMDFGGSTLDIQISKAEQQGKQEAASETRSLDSFLAGVERKAFVLARAATGDTEDALDVVQDTMFKLVQKYAGRQAREWEPLFFRILQNSIRDFHRKRVVKEKVFGFFTRNKPGEEFGKEEGMAIEFEDVRTNAQPLAQLEELALTRFVRHSVKELPLRQQQVFLLRCWLEYDVKETANIMGCSEGSVKTHYSRATNALKEVINEGVIRDGHEES